jgi:hypothetical protein
MSDDIPQWAKDRACEIAKASGVTPGGARDADFAWGRAFARYIAEHEEPPVDPLLVEAREIAAKARPDYAEGYLSGGYDTSSTEIRTALLALRRGIERGKQP